MSAARGWVGGESVRVREQGPGHCTPVSGGGKSRILRWHLGALYSHARRTERLRQATAQPPVPGPGFSVILPPVQGEADGAAESVDPGPVTDSHELFVPRLNLIEPAGQMVVRAVPADHGLSGGVIVPLDGFQLDAGVKPGHGVGPGPTIDDAPTEPVPNA